MWKFLILSTALLIVGTTATDIKQCNRGQPLPISVDIEGCQEPPCTFVKGTTTTMYIRFAATKDNINSLRSMVQVSMMGITVPFELSDDVSNVCDKLMDGATCPIQKSEEVVYAFQLHIDYIYPEVSMNLQVSLEDEERDSIACFVSAVNIRNDSGN